MKRIIVGLLVFAVAISPLFRGLFFPYETWPFLTAIAILSAVYFLLKLAARESMRFSKWITVLGLVLILAYTLSFIHAANTRESIAAVIRYTVYFILGCVIYDYYCGREKQFALTVMIPVVLSGFISAIIGIEALSKAFSILNVTLNSSDKRVGATFQYANTAALYFLICMIFSLTLMDVLKKPVVKILFVGFANTLFLGLVLTGSRGGYLICGFALLFLMVFQPAEYKVKTLGNILCAMLPAFYTATRIARLTGTKDYVTLTKWLILSFMAALILGAFWQAIVRLAARVNIRPAVKGLIAFMLVVAVLLAATVIGVERLIPESVLQRFARFNMNDRNIYIRTVFIKDSLKLIADNWLLGVGGGGWTSLYYSVQEEYYTARAVHNHYLEVFLESGVLGFVAFAGLVLTALFYWIRTLVKSRDSEKKLLVVGFLNSLLALLIHCLFDFDLNYASMFLLFWLFLAGSAIFRFETGESGIERISWISGSQIVKLAGVVMCSVALSFGGIYSLASWHAHKGQEFMRQGNIAEARMHYEKAYSIDSLNPKHTFELAKIYNYYAGKASEPEKARIWRNLAIQASEKGMALDRYYPAYRELAVRTYLDAGLPEKAYRTAEELVAYQPRKDSNYELLAQSYLEAGIALINSGDSERGRELLVLCTRVGERPDPKVSKAIRRYREKAEELLGYGRQTIEK